MKTYHLQAFSFLFLVALSRASAQEPFNPAPAVIQSPADGADAVTKRLTVSADGKTPTSKNLDAAWIASLGQRGAPKIYTKDNSHNFDYLGMPVGGIGAGELYLSGDGRLWEWDIFGTKVPQGGFPVEQGSAYVNPHVVRKTDDPFQNVIDQGFVIRTKQDGNADTRTLDKDGFSTISFSGQYPVGSVDYTDPASPVHVHLDAYSPFIPAHAEDSTYPATILSYTVENTSKDKVECTVGGWMENAAGINVRNQTPILLQDSATKQDGATILNFGMKEVPAQGDPSTVKPPAMFDDFESGKYDHWKAEGDAFGDHPMKLGEVSHGSQVSGAQGHYFIDTYIHGNDHALGKLTSDSFTINRPYLTFLIGGGNSADKECVNLLVDGKAVRTATGNQDEILRPVGWDLKDLQGKSAQIQIVDASTEGWGHIMADNFAFADKPGVAVSVKDQVDVGNMALAVLGDGSEAVAQVKGDKSSDGSLDTAAADSAEQPISGVKEHLVGAVRRTVTLAPGEKKTLSFILAWYFPNPMPLGLHTPTSRQYSVRFKSAGDVAEHLVTDFDRLSQATFAWRDTWYDSTLPYWFLDRTFLNTSTLASSTDYFLSDGRFYGYEGRYSCPGTCTHVYGYQQTLGYVFPDLERAIMEKTEYKRGVGFNEDGGGGMRGEYDHNPPVDGQSGIILRTYLAHRMSPDDEFLKRNYPSIKKATDYLINKYDTAHAGILVGAQANTMDSAWYGNNTWMSLYYQAALRAAAEMADDSNDGDYAKSLRAIADKGRGFIETQLFNGEYFIHQPDTAHPESPGTFNGCPLEQLMGQNWANEVGLGDIVDPAKTLTALNSIWKYDYTTDTGAYRKVFTAGRWYAKDGEGGLIMCTFPHGGEDTLKKGNMGFSAYDNECWTGSEFEITAEMMWAGMADKALAEVRTINERYDGAKRNPWDECECGSHYSRAMSSYGVFTAAEGYEYNGPKGYMAFAPRVSPDNFKSAFTAAEGWGSYSQKYSGQGLTAAIDLKYGKLSLKTLALVPPAGSKGDHATVTLDGKDVPTQSSLQNGRLLITFGSEVMLNAGQKLNVEVK
jgi:non-lysosomal glucosylceramidase